ncbi:hypothetical protein HYH03_018386 [Edaphochlamys debaryana]|uniref:Rhamnosyl O-methyltransferase n=1 Tax=Edaphochlamys debaryana TaxID=47281 RepID=A0A835XI25_9CHLO|nr:hypothetical protein HYH03_018386 [Edaphochlamys debaryana]|eukprot:KAG2482706.1 hypothetical protein HYH03_018386 [Edaphochlamys debaryana]
MHLALLLLLLVTVLLASLVNGALGEDGHGHGRLRTGRARHLPDKAVPINLYELLGPDAYLKGVLWQPMSCYAPTSQNLGSPGEAKVALLEAEMMKELAAALAEITGKPAQSFTPACSILSALDVPSLDQMKAEMDPVYRKAAMRGVVADPRFWVWMRKLSLVALRYTITRFAAPGATQFEVLCPDTRMKELMGVNLVPMHSGLDCTNTTAVLRAGGLFNDPIHHLETIVKHVVRDPGWCSAQPMYEPYGVWLKKEKMMSHRRGDQRFRLDNRHKDRVMFLFDLLYESDMAFKRQFWMGAVVQQNPFDMYAIMDIIHTVKPQLIVETGTANGGSALMWASMLELEGLQGARVITIDVNDPGNAHWSGEWDKREVVDPTKHRLWSKYVTFIKNSSLDPGVLATVRQAASTARGVLVLLDSDHTEEHVLLECKAYCPLVNEGSYCIVEDTKLSRFSVVGGPTPSIRRFLNDTRDFAVDRAREPFYTQHVGGYLKRVPAGTGGWKEEQEEQALGQGQGMRRRRMLRAGSAASGGPDRGR